MIAYNPYRSTKDTDLTAFGNWDEQSLKQAFESLKTDNSERAVDNVWYSGKIRTRTISKGRSYVGFRIRIKAHIESETRQLSFDISFGSALAQRPTWWNFGTLVPKMKPPSKLKIYPVPAVIAEKVHSMHEYPDPDTYDRIRDVYDIAFLATLLEFDGSTLFHAIRHTFESRAPTYADPATGDYHVFWPHLPDTMTRLGDVQNDWDEILEYSGDTYAPSPDDALNLVRLLVSDILFALAKGTVFEGNWPPQGLWHR